MMTTYERSLQLLQQLPLPDKIRLLEELSTSIKQDLETEAYKHIPWEQFIDLTYGSLADDPIERNQPLMQDDRDPIE